MVSASLGTRSGTVSDFDHDRGLGVVSTESVDYPFHCTAIVDGSRTIEVGTAVVFEVVAGRQGRWEASRVRPVDA